MFERYVNFEFYKTILLDDNIRKWFERYVNFEFYKTFLLHKISGPSFERYVNFEFYKPSVTAYDDSDCLREDM